MENKKRFLVVLIALSFISSPGYCASKVSNVSTCEGLNNVFEDLDCIDASQTGAICDPDEEIISLPRKLQLCCCLRNSNQDVSADTPTDVPDDPTADPLAGFPNFRSKN